MLSVLSAPVLQVDETLGPGLQKMKTGRTAVAWGAPGAYGSGV